MRSLLTSLTHVWQLENNSWTDSVGSMNLTGNGAATTVAGKVGTAADLSDATSYLEHADDASLQYPLSGDFTVAAWIYNPTEPASVRGVVGKGTGLSAGSLEYVLALSSSHKVSFRISGSNGAAAPVALEAGANLAAGVWTWAVGEIDSVNLLAKASRNNGTAGTISYAEPRLTGTATFRLGKACGQNSLVYVDEVCTWNRLLTAAEKTFLYNGGNGVAYPAWCNPEKAMHFASRRAA